MAKFFETFEWNPDQRIIAEAVSSLSQNEIGIIPTDSVYSVICALQNKRGIETICKLLGKKPEKANLSVIFKDMKDVSAFTMPFSTSAYKTMKRNLPGPFTFILKANSEVPKLFLNNRKTIGIRIPEHSIPIEICKTLDQPLVCASVHSEDEIQEYLTESEEIFEAFDNKVDFIITTQHTGNSPSTVVDLTENEPIIIRQGKGELI
jgi:tRNA threonylcarbamoyl adenosine modification protein (Sua5/YciO/YrdC/YwlC family)